MDMASASCPNVPLIQSFAIILVLTSSFLRMMTIPLLLSILIKMTLINNQLDNNTVTHFSNIDAHIYHVQSANNIYTLFFHDIIY
jgi:hypothetical protein